MGEDTQVKTKHAKKSIIAKGDFIIAHNEYRFDIKEGDDIVKLGVPEIFYPNLKTELII